MEEIVLESSTYHTESLLRAAQVLAGQGRIWLRSTKTRCEVRLEPADGADAKALAGAFLEEAAAQEVRRRIAAANRPVREYIVTQALIAAAGERGSGPGPGPALSAEEEGEIQRLIQEAEREIEARASAEDPEGVAQAWEERPERPEGSAGA